MNWEKPTLNSYEFSLLNGRSKDPTEQAKIEKVAARLYSVWHWRSQEDREYAAANYATLTNGNERKRFGRLAVEVLKMMEEEDE